MASMVSTADLTVSTLPALSVARYSSSCSPSPVTSTGWVYGVLAAAAGAALLVEAHRLYAATRRGEPGRPMRLFHLSNSYLAFVFVAVAVDTFLR